MNAEAAEDLARLGGPIEEAAQETVPAEPAEDARISFADLAPEPVAAEPPPAPPEPAPEPAQRRSETTAVVPAIEPIEVPRTLERPAISAEQARMAQDRTLGMEAVPPSPPPAPPAEEPAPLGLETTAFTPPTADAAPATPSTEGFQSFDDQLQWGAGERQSRAIHADDIAEAEAHHEATGNAIDFMGSEPPASAHEAGSHPDEPAADAPLALEPAPEAPAASGAEPMSGVEASPEPMALDVSEHPPAPSWETQHASSAAFVMPEEAAEPAPTPEPEPVAPAPAHDLPLIMPEDVTPPDELRRPSLKQVQMVSPEPIDLVESGVASDALLITETMGDLYFKQGLKEQAAAVYRRLLATRPGDAGLQAKLSAIESPPAFSAAALGAEAVGSWLRRVASAQLPTAAPAAPPAPEAGQTPMEQAFQASEPEPAPAPSESAAAASASEPSGSPARAATDNYSLDQIFGASGAPAAASAAPAAPQAPAPAGQGNVLGASFDEFFGAAPKTETVRPKEATPAAARQSEDDLSAFNAWLHGLKR